MKKTYDIGLTAGVFDLFHVGHLNILKRCKQHCKKLIVVVLTDKYCLKRKGKLPTICQEDRVKILKAIRYVDAVVLQDKDFQVLDIANKHNAEVVFKGSDKKDDPRWRDFYSAELKKLGIDLKFFPYTKGISTTKILSQID